MTHLANYRFVRTIPLLITACLVSFPAYAQYSGGTGEPNDPYQIATAEDLMLLGESPEDYDKHFILTADIDLDPTLPGRKIFDKAAIAPNANAVTKSDFQGSLFLGSLDGNGYAIKNLTIRLAGACYIGLFGKIGTSGKIYDLGLEDIDINCSGFYISGLVGYNRGSIMNCHINGSVSGGTVEWCSYVALLAGRNRGQINHCDIDGIVSNGGAQRGSFFGLLAGQNECDISNCSVRGNIVVEGSFSSIGGLAGKNLCSIEDCDSTAGVSVNGRSDYGDLVGTNIGIINRSYATGNVSFGRYDDKAGGLVGYNTGSIISCYATGNVSGTHSNWRLGGLAGLNWGNIVHCYATGITIGNGDIGGLVGENLGTISHSYAIGQVSRVNSAGGLVGDGHSDDVSRCYWDNETSGQTRSEGGEGLSTALMQDPLTFLEAGWDFPDERVNGTCDVWQMPEGGGYPALTVFSGDYQTPKLAGSGTPDDPYLIAAAEDLGAILHNDCKAYYKLVADVNLAGITWTTTVIPSFDGTFDGNGFTISNLTIHGGEYLGLFGVLEKRAVVKNLGIKDANIVGGSTASDLGILAVENRGLITNCRITGIVSGGQYEEHLGGIVRHNVGTMTDCDPIDYNGPYSVIISDPKATQEFLIFDRVEFDQVWIPEEADLEGLDSTLEALLESDKPIQENIWLDREYILDNFSLYDREYSGFILDDSKYIICQMILWGIERDEEPPDRFSFICDGGCGVVRVIFDAKSKAVIGIGCHGM